MDQTPVAIKLEEGTSGRCKQCGGCAIRVVTVSITIISCAYIAWTVTEIISIKQQAKEQGVIIKELQQYITSLQVNIIF